MVSHGMKSSVEIAESLSHTFFGKNFVKVMVLLNKDKS